MSANFCPPGGLIQQKRFAGDKNILKKNPVPFMDCYQDENNPLVWYFIIEGQNDSPFGGGEFIGKIVHNPSYPAKAPDYYMMTPNGRFDVETKLCLTNSSFHQETWSSTWTIAAMLIGFYSMFISTAETEQKGAGFTIDTNDEKKRKLAKESKAYNEKYLSAISKKFDRSRFVNNK
jgi:ubiquitin-protein ligase